MALSTQLVSAQTLGNRQDRLGGFLSVGTGDIYRGLIRSYYDLSVQGGLRYRWSEQISAGVSVNRAQFRQGPTRISDDIEIDYFVTWTRPVSGDVSWRAQFKRYTFPGSSNRSREYDYNEFSLGVDGPNNLSATTSISDLGEGFGQGDVRLEVLWHTALSHRIELSAAVGVAQLLEDDRDRSRDQYRYWDVGVSRSSGRLNLDLRYHHSPDALRWFGFVPATGQWVLSTTMGW